MCGICGMVAANGRPVDRRVLEAMNAVLEHRGPDSAGVLVDGSAGLAMRRLAIIDLDGGDQPICDERGDVAVVSNGEIYNFRELRADLQRRGHRFATESDTEVLVHGYEEHGTHFAEQLRGMFACAVWDSPRRRLVLARDRFGIKPLYYAVRDGAISFASELKGLLRDPSLAREVDPSALEAFLARGFVPGELTIFAGVRKLLPGHILVWEDGVVTIERFARPAPVARADVREQPFDVLAAELRERLRESVRAHLVADVDVGLLLSGGVDSSMLAALAAEEGSGSLKTFSVGFEDASFDELDRARLVAHRYATDHHELVVRPSAADALAKIVGAFDEPFADSSALPTYLVSELAAGHVKVALAGEGGDELFGGYFTYVADGLAPVVGPLAGRLSPLIERLPSSSRATRWDDKAKRFARGARLGPLERHMAWQEIFSADAREDLLRPERRGGADPLALYERRYAETEGAEQLARFQDLDLGLYLVDQLLVKSDRCSMANSLELRVPFLDTAVSDLALALPARFKVRGLAKKRLLRAAAAPLVPDEVLAGRKQGFSIPAAAWLRNELQPFARDVLSPAEVRRDGFFDPDVVTALLDDHVARRADHSRHIWALLSFKLWLDGASSAAAAPLPVGAAG